MSCYLITFINTHGYFIHCFYTFKIYLIILLFSLFFHYFFTFHYLLSFYLSYLFSFSSFVRLHTSCQYSLLLLLPSVKWKWAQTAPDLFQNFILQRNDLCDSGQLFARPNHNRQPMLVRSRVSSAQHNTTQDNTKRDGVDATQKHSATQHRNTRRTTVKQLLSRTCV
jgi:hypothetical protein